MDRVGSTDEAVAGISTEVVAHQHPCPKCGKAMKDANTEETIEQGKDLRICSSRICRAFAEWSTGEPILQK